MRFRAARPRAAGGAWRVALLPPAAFAVHQLRYALAFGSRAGIELQRTGHSYLQSVAPWLVLALALAAGCLIKLIGDAFAGHTSPSRFTVSFAALWAGCTGILVAVFACQELLEGALLTGHPGGVAGVFGYGGWWAVPAALCVALVLAAVFHGARWVVAEIARRRTAGAPRWQGPALAMPCPADALLVALGPLPRGRSSRGPPRRPAIRHRSASARPRGAAPAFDPHL